MFKQILSKIPRKSSKSSENLEHKSVSSAGYNASSSVRKSDVGNNRSGHQNNLSANGGSSVGHNDGRQVLRTKNLREKEIKRQTLLELVDYITSASGKFPENVMQEIVKMVSVNLFRSLAAQPRENKVIEAYDVEDDEPLMDASWPYLQIVYEFLLRFVASPETDAKLAKRYIDHSFVLKLLDLFDSEDPREREYLKTVLHRIYGKFMVHRPYIRKAINNLFYEFIFETEKFINNFWRYLGVSLMGSLSHLKRNTSSFLLGHSYLCINRGACLCITNNCLIA